MEQELLDKWEQNYKKGLLSFWMLMALVERRTYAYEMKAIIEDLSQGSISPDENSIYRALRRFAKNGLVASEVSPSDQGPPRRYFELTGQGQELLAAFTERNILIFQSESVQATIQKILVNKQ